MPLADATIRNLKPRDKPYKLWDFEGLLLLVKPTRPRLLRGDHSGSAAGSGPRNRGLERVTGVARQRSLMGVALIPGHFS